VRHPHNLYSKLVCGVLCGVQSSASIRKR